MFVDPVDDRFCVLMECKEGVECRSKDFGRLAEWQQGAIGVDLWVQLGLRWISSEEGDR